MSDNAVRERLQISLSEISRNGKPIRQKEVAQDLGYTREGTLSEMLNGKRAISAKFLKAFCATYGISETWLAKGVGPMLAHAYDQLPISEQQALQVQDGSVGYANDARLLGDMASTQYYISKGGNVFVELPESGSMIQLTKLVSSKAAASYMRGWGDPSYIDNLPVHPIVVDKVYKGYYLSFEVTGDSMDDRTDEAIKDGDIVVCRRIDRHLWENSKLHLQSFEDFLIHHRDGLTVKRVKEHNVEGRTLLCHSLNPDKEHYPDFSINLDDVSEIYNVVDVNRKRKKRK